jgi:GNAT superfamily N-acetyltransferase
MCPCTKVTRRIECPMDSTKPMAAKITHTLEMTSASDLLPKIANIHDVRIDKLEPPCPEFNSFLHTMVGFDYRWGGRVNWGQKEWCAYANREELETWVAYIKGTPAGYFEFVKHATGDVQIECFGLLPQFVGKGLGGMLLTRAVQRAWEVATGKVFLRTCSYDHPHALKNYKARGFRIAKTEHGPPISPINSFWELVETCRPS